MAEPFAETPSGVRASSAQREVMLEVDEARGKTVLMRVLENAVEFSLPEDGASLRHTFPR